MIQTIGRLAAQVLALAILTAPAAFAADKNYVITTVQHTARETAKPAETSDAIVSSQTGTSENPNAVAMESIKVAHEGLD